MFQRYLAVALIGAAVFGSVGCSCCRKATVPPPPCCPPGGVAPVPAPVPAISGYRAAAAPCPTCVTR